MLKNIFTGQKVSATGTLIWFILHALILCALMVYFPVIILLVIIAAVFLRCLSMYMAGEIPPEPKDLLFYIYHACILVVLMLYWPMGIPFFVAGTIIVQSLYLYIEGALD